MAKQEKLDQLKLKEYISRDELLRSHKERKQQLEKQLEEHSAPLNFCLCRPQLHSIARHC